MAYCPELCQYATPSDRARRCVWADMFSTWEQTRRNGVITVGGSPAINKGVTLDGATNYLKYDVNGLETYNPEQSFHVEFYPTFAANDGLAHYIFDINGPRVQLQKAGVGGTNNLYIANGGILILNIPLATYQGLWNVNGRNLVTAKMVSGANQVWMNGSSLGTSVTAWTPAKATGLYVGSSIVPSLYTGGIITMLKLYHSSLTQAEHLAVWNAGRAWS